MRSSRPPEQIFTYVAEYTRGCVYPYIWEGLFWYLPALNRGEIRFIPYPYYNQADTASECIDVDNRKQSSR